MNHISLLFYMFLFYLSIALFFWNFNTFTLQEKIIMFTLISGFQCIAGLTSGEMKV